VRILNRTNPEGNPPEGGRGQSSPDRGETPERGVLGENKTNFIPLARLAGVCRIWHDIFGENFITSPIRGDNLLPPRNSGEMRRIAAGARADSLRTIGPYSCAWILGAMAHARNDARLL